MKDVIGLLDCHNCASLGELTSSRTLASTSFLGRYAFSDFAMSNFCNADIQTVGILVQNHQRSILKHMGNMLSWVTNTKTGRVSIFYNEKAQMNPLYNNDINNIKQNDWVLYDSDASYIVFMAPQYVMNIDLASIIEEHIERKDDITIVYHHSKTLDKEFQESFVLNIGEDGYIKNGHKNKGEAKEGDVSLETWIINRTVLADIIRRHDMADLSFGMREMLALLIERGVYRARAYRFDGFVRCFDSLEHYIEYSFQMLEKGNADALFIPERPIYTLTHDTPPALYGTNSDVRNSFISNGCIIEGSVQDSIVCRNVKIGPNAKVKRAILLSDVKIGPNAKVSDVIADKYAVVTAKHTISGGKDDLIYISQGAIL